jgi:hypothetical protein
MQDLCDSDRELEILDDQRAQCALLSENSLFILSLAALRYGNSSKLLGLPSLRWMQGAEDMLQTHKGALTLYYYYVFSCRYNNYRLLGIGYFGAQECMARLKPLSRAPRSAQKYQARLFKQRIKAYGDNSWWASINSLEKLAASLYMGAIMLCTKCVYLPELRGLLEHSNLLEIPNGKDLAAPLVRAMIEPNSREAQEELLPYLDLVLGLI